MHLVEIIALVVSITAVIAYLNDRYLGLPTALGTFVGALAFALVLVVLDAIGLVSDDWAAQMLYSIKWGDLLLHGLLGFLLFAAAIQLDGSLFSRNRWSITYMATIGVVLSALLTTILIVVILGYLHSYYPKIGLSWWPAFVFAAMIVPTDPVLVGGLLRKLKITPAVKGVIFGESLFNDAVAIVLFIFAVGMTKRPDDMHFSTATLYILQIGGGGVILGILLGSIATYMLNTSRSDSVHQMITIGVVVGGYSLAEYIGVSAPLALVLAGMIIAKYRGYAQAKQEHPVLSFWRAIESTINAILFALIGLELVTFDWEWGWQQGVILSSLIIFPLIIIARYISLLIPWVFSRVKKKVRHSSIVLMTWCGMRGGVSFALALSIDHDVPYREPFIFATFIIVVLSIMIQGFTVPMLARWDASKYEDTSPEGQ